MTKIKIGTRILLGFGLALLISAVVSVISYRSTTELLDIADWVAHTHKVLESIADVRSTMKDAETAQRGYLITGEDRYLEPYQVAVRVVDRQIQDLKELTADNRNQQRRIATVQSLTANKLSELKETIELRKNKGFAAAAQVVLTDRGKTVMDEIRRVLTAMEDEEHELLKQRDQEAKAKAGYTTSVIVFGGLLALILVSVAGVTIQRSITRPLSKFMQFVERIGRGDLTQQAAVLSRDEIGILAQGLNQMAQGLNGLAAQTRTVTENLNSATAEILASTQQQAAGTAEQSAAVQQTSATMQEVSQSGAQISDRAKQVAASAEATGTASKSGLQAVQNMTLAMDAIREQAEAVAENVVALSEKTQAVGEIVATVNDIAEQSNLLALNAAIGAAAAGEHGRSFAVVANEMKNLADQAKTATVQVRSILGDIQKGINTSVMLTEEAVKRVEAGKQQTDVADQTIRHMADNIELSVQAFQQIVAATNQQQIGFDQVAQALKNISTGTAQTAASTRQLEKAAANLNALGQQLKGSVERYTI
jgi:methyl-accepting chemotaxis protein